MNNKSETENTFDDLISLNISHSLTKIEPFLSSSSYYENQKDSNSQPEEIDDVVLSPSQYNKTNLNIITNDTLDVNEKEILGKESQQHAFLDNKDDNSVETIDTNQDKYFPDHISKSENIITTTAKSSQQSLKNNEECKKKHIIFQAAPFPDLPSKYILQTIISEMDAIIENEKFKLKNLVLEKQRIDKERKTLEIPRTKNICEGIILSRGLVNDTTLYDNIISVNKKTIDISHNKYIVKADQQFDHISNLPYFSDCHLLKDNVTNIIYEKLCELKKEDHEKKVGLSIVFNERYKEWEKHILLLDEYHKVSSETTNQWPLEFVEPRTHDEFSHIGSVDIPMLSEYEMLEKLVYDENLLVKDPVASHKEFKNRVRWTDEEKKIFYEKYGQFPRDFKKIASALPNKCIKDVIEYYYVNRPVLNLGEVDRASRQKGRKRRTAPEV